jgi:hypothetical protein
MPGYATIKVEFCPDPLSDITPTYVDVTRYCMGVDWSAGKQRDLDDPQAGGATIRLRNDQRRFEPEYVAGAYYPNVVPLRRFRLTITADGTSYGEGVFYATSWDVTYPTGQAYSEVVVSCVDGFGLLSLDLLPALDPPDASTISDVIAFDAPFAYYRMNDLGGSTLIGRKKRKHHHHHTRHRHNYRVIPPTLADEGSGSDGKYVSSPLPPFYNQPTLVVGDADQSVEFLDASGGFARVALADAGQFGDTNQVTIECLFKPSASVDGSQILCGPFVAGNHTFDISTVVVGSNFYTFDLTFTDTTSIGVQSTTVVTPGVAVHVAATWNGVVGNIYINGILESSDTRNSGKHIQTGGTTDYLYIGGSNHLPHVANGWVDEVAFFEQALPASRIKAHADAALNRGYPQQVEGDRVTAIVTSDLWAETKIDAGQFQIAPVMQVGQAKLDELTRTAHSAEPWAQLYFDGVGDPVYLGWDYLGVGSRSTPAAIFGDSAGEVPYTDITLTYDDEIYNSVTISGDTGLAQTATDAASQSAYRTRALSDTGLALALDSDALAVAGTIRDGWANPMFRCDAITLNGANAMSRTQILTRTIGDLIRVRRRGAGGTPIDVITRILGKSKSFDPNGNLTCTWSLARGFNAADGFWHLGVTGFSELNTTDALA